MLGRDTVFAKLKAVGWFSGLTPTQQDRLMGVARVFEMGAGESLYTLDDPDVRLFGIAEGSIVVNFPREDGVVLPMASLGQGTWMGELAVMSGHPGLLSVDARTDIVGVSLAAPRVRHLLEVDPAFHAAFYELNRINQALSLRLMAGLTAETAERRVAIRLKILSDYLPPGHEWVELTHSDLAGQVGLSLPSVQRALKSLSQTGCIELGYARIRVLDKTALVQGA